MPNQSEVKDPAALAILMAHRAASESLARLTRDREINGIAPLTIPDDAKAPEWTPGETIVRYEAWEYPRGNIVIEVPSRHIEASFARIEEARLHADQLNKWLAARPAPDRRYRIFELPPEPTEAGIMALVDRIYDTGALEGSPVETLLAGVTTDS